MGEFVLAEMTQTFDQSDVSYFFPLMQQAEQRLGFRPRFGTLMLLLMLLRLRILSIGSDDPPPSPRFLFPKGGGYKSRKFDRPTDCPSVPRLSHALLFAYTDRTVTLIEHERGKYVCPFFFLRTSNTNGSKQSCRSSSTRGQ